MQIIILFIFYNLTGNQLSFSITAIIFHYYILFFINSFMKRARVQPKKKNYSSQQQIQRLIPTRRRVAASKLQIKKQDPQEKQQLYLQDASEKQGQKQDEVQDENESDEDESGEQSDDEQESESEQKPSQLAIKKMQFRPKRGEKMKYLISRKKDEQQSDDFWKNNKFFGEQKQIDKDQGSDYIESSSGKDEFDSDFLSNDNIQKQQQQQIVEEPESESEKKKKKIQDFEIPKKPIKKIKKPEPQKQSCFKYIHEQYSQQQLLAEAAHTQYFNYLSLQKLISLEQQKKNYEQKHHEIKPPKIVYKDSCRGDKREFTIALVGFEQGTTLFDLKDVL